MADVFPPSYESATTRDVWPVIAPYILCAADLCSASLVCRTWHEIFVPILWGAPASHFGARDDAVYGEQYQNPHSKKHLYSLQINTAKVALTRFRRVLNISRSSVRQFTHTLHLPPALSEIYGEPPPSWLHDFVEYLPNLQSLLVSRLPFFDHGSLVALGKGDEYNLRLLLAERELNATSVGLTAALKRFLRLVYLDLSYTTAARDSVVLFALSQLRDLQVFKLRGVGLQDDDMAVLSRSIQDRVRVLDIRDNRLSDRGLSLLTRYCFLPYGGGHTGAHVNAHFGPLTGALLAGSIRSERLDGHLLRLFTRRLSGLSALEELPHAGITHLYVAGNKISADSLISLLHTRRLNVLDAGDVDTKMEKLIPIFRSPTAQGLTYLRVHHSILTHGTIGVDYVPSKETRDGLPLNEKEPSMIQRLLAKRPTLYQETADKPLCLHPSNISHIQTLVLIDVPAFVPESSPIISSLTRFISACADESLLASLQAQSNYSLPPGQYRAKAIQQHSKELFALNTIVLEVAPTGKLDKLETLPTWAPTSYYQPGTFKSSTGDLDSEKLWAAAANDFSFFDQDEEGQGVRSALDSVRDQPPARMVDLIAELAAFRREKRDAYNNKIQNKHSRILTADGHWKGEVKIVRSRL
ncbi:hypothetical protein McanMca71_000072 [Microsporum canis]|uniref:Leucine Rich Repeat domain-containing protein n=1 Tax=Arthroderma otae (strain ATCC MYA-4605 / CBS 113480) TaxID=554155 RepID=C5FCM6_ARTOC|nr:leucine Rich Repeat domain-containing protein [Microsporum canis CBS 113480]EEQ27560.1 leucine Rich Repeat domain-containing protein [Microsporum canis CBS 113480]